jgi:iron complex transport system substrate-binding protein
MINKDKVLLLVVDDKGMKAFGQTGRFGGFLNKDLGIQPFSFNSRLSVLALSFLSKILPKCWVVVSIEEM